MLQRFYRSECGRDNAAPGYGLGLSIAAAIVPLRGFRLRIGDSVSGGARVSVQCWSDAL